MCPGAHKELVYVSYAPEQHPNGATDAGLRRPSCARPLPLSRSSPFVRNALTGGGVLCWWMHGRRQAAEASRWCQLEKMGRRFDRAAPFCGSFLSLCRKDGTFAFHLRSGFFPKARPRPTGRRMGTTPSLCRVRHLLPKKQTDGKHFSGLTKAEGYTLAYERKFTNLLPANAWPKRGH